MKRVTVKLPLFLAVMALIATGCAAPKGQVRDSVEEAEVAKVLSVTGEELPDRVRLNIEGTTTLAYTVFRLSEPLRLIVDLADTDVTGLDEGIPVNLGNVSNVSPLQFDEDAGRIGRLEISLLELWEYETSRLGNTILIDFMKPVSVAEEPLPSEEPAVKEEKPVEEIQVAVPEEVPAVQSAPVPQVMPPAGFVNSVLFEESEGGMIVQLIGDGSLKNYTVMDLADPTRIVLDVKDVAKGFAPSRIPVDTGDVRQVRVGEHFDQNKLRFVLDIEGELPPYTVRPEGSKLVIRLGEGPILATPPLEKTPAADSSALANLPVVFATPEEEPAEVPSALANLPVTFAEPEKKEAAPEPAQAGPTVTDIRYRAEADGGAVLIISETPVQYEATRPDASHLLLDLPGVILSRDLVRSQDTRDMEGALHALSSYNPRGETGARVSLAFAPGTTSEIHQSGGTVTITLGSPEAGPAAVPAVQAPAAPVAATAAPVPAPEPLQATAVQLKPIAMPKYTGEKITLDFQNAELLNVLRLIAEVSGLNIITAEGVGGKLTMRMVDVPWDQALDIILKTKSLGQVKEGNVIRIAPLSSLENERLAALKAKEAEIKVEDLSLEIIPISYSKAEDLVNQLGSFLSPRGSVSTDARTNSLIVKDIQDNIDRVKELVATLDIPTPQVRIEARIVIVDEGYVKNLGIQWGGAYVTSDGTRIFGESGTGATTFSNALVNLPASNANTVLGVTFGNVDNFENLDLRLSALEQTNRGKIISSPSLMVIQNETANIEVNNPFPENRTSTEVNEAGSTTTTEVTFPNIWTKLKITPQVTSSKDIFMEIFVEKDSKGQQAIFDNNTFTGVNSHKLETKIILNNNGTAVIGGVYTENEVEAQSSVPFISKIPILGWLFKNKNTENTRDELLIFINATIIEG